MVQARPQAGLWKHLTQLRDLLIVDGYRCLQVINGMRVKNITHFSVRPLPSIYMRWQQAVLVDKA